MVPSSVLDTQLLAPLVGVADRLGDGAVDPGQGGVGRALLELEDVPLAVEQDHRRIELHLEGLLHRAGPSMLETSTG